MLLYSLTMGPIEQTIARQAKQARQQLPDNIKNAPVLEEGLQLFLQAFFDLQSERIDGFSVGRIPISRVRQYARDCEFDSEQAEDLIYYVNRLDVEYVKYYTSKHGQSS